MKQKTFDLHKGYSSNRLNPFLKGLLTITETNIFLEEWHTNHPPSERPCSFRLCAYVYFIDEYHYVVSDLNNKPYIIFHEFEDLANWANKIWNPYPNTKTPQCSLPPSHPRQRRQKKLHKDLQKFFDVSKPNPRGPTAKEFQKGLEELAKQKIP